MSMCTSGKGETWAWYPGGVWFHAGVVLTSHTLPVRHRGPRRFSSQSLLTEASTEPFVPPLGRRWEHWCSVRQMPLAQDAPGGIRAPSLGNSQDKGLLPSSLSKAGFKPVACVPLLRQRGKEVGCSELRTLGFCAHLSPGVLSTPPTVSPVPALHPRTHCDCARQWVDELTLPSVSDSEL